MKLSNGRIRRCHQEELRNREAKVDVSAHSDMEDDVTLRQSSLGQTGNPNDTNGMELDDMQPVTTHCQEVPADIPDTAKKYPSRARHPVQRYDLTWT